jgi:hypothetical protein
MTIIIENFATINLTKAETIQLSHELDRVIQLARDSGKFEIDNHMKVIELNSHLRYWRGNIASTIKT